MAPKRGYRPINNGAANLKQSTNGQKRKHLFPLWFVSFLLWAAILAISVLVATGCVYSNSLYIIQVHSNDTTPVQVQLGYLGTCVSTNTNAFDANSNTTNTACVQHLKYDDDQSLVSQFVEEFKEKNAETEIPDIEEPLSKILPISEQLRSKIFPASLPVSFLVIYILSIFSFWCLLPHSSHSRAYKTIFAVTTLLNAYALTVGFIVATTTWKACMALIFPSEGNTGTIQDGVFVTQNNLLQNMQWVIVGLSIVLQICIAVLFVQRGAARASGSEVSFKPTTNIKSYTFFCC
ncbi:hypothetical protein F5Y02DRAFT_428514 [Annulohypoxylon stygium]|nr:hypothetical protein F5Y02DRAFT_428514 [Annulohypoxylon stygium]